MVGAGVSVDRGEGAGSESSGYCGDWEGAVMIGSVQRQEYGIAASPLRGEFCKTGDPLRLVRLKQRSIVISEGALWCRGDGGGE